MSETTTSFEQSAWSPLKTLMAVAIGSALGGGVYGLAELRHSRQEAEHAAHAAPLLAADALTAPQPAEHPQAAEREANKADAEQPQPAAAQPSDAKEAEVAAAPSEPEDPKERALAARTAAEKALLDEARAQLEANQAAAALATLDRMKKRFARGSLAQERELLRIEVYKARGQNAAAKRAARKFAKAFPESEHLGELEPLIKI